MNYNSLFNRDFYPTPQAVIDQMMMGVDVTNKVVLEPSAGNGRIVDWLKQAGAKEVLACEIQPDLAKVIDRKCRLVGHDFLTLTAEEVSHIDMIVMNPPFTADERHILHAWAIAPGGCQIVALCNSSTLENRYSSNREALNEMVKQNGRSECFGNCFNSEETERRTNVSVSCVYLFKPKTGEEEFDGYFSMEEEIEDQQNGIMPYNSIREIVNRYVSAVKMFDSVMDANKVINELAAPIGGGYIEFGARKHGDNGLSTLTKEQYKKELQKSAWRSVFKRMNLDKYVTTGVNEQINKFVEQQIHVPFTMRNIGKMLDMIVGTHAQRMDRVLVEAFEMICSFSSENSTAGEKWKTNADYMVNRKFIVPCICEYDSRWATHHVKTGYGGNANKIDDIDKALCHLTGERYSWKEINKQGKEVECSRERLRDFFSYSHNEMYRAKRWGEWHDWGFFRVKAFKKGTMHFEFRDENLCAKFNQRVASIKGWALPKNTQNGKRKKAA